ncbi:hypothetical protein FA95DRAFT_52767 [Auriscalpium vulgare]|uniref:Uncharacterized protein n=1 Tax=Auriscalpium vulgare TaxID=40419 RepID=A0ACB8S7G6_9AGAM|nr:hypothetical protein FA95DRAFT_52767 [Auriscalpium vulgare]
MSFRDDDSAPISPMQTSEGEFYNSTGDETALNGPSFQRVVMRALTSTSDLLGRRLKSLTIEGLYDGHQALYDETSFRALLASLTHLHISTTTHPTSHEVGLFWSTDVQRSFLSTPSSTLTSLTLASDQQVGVNPHLDFGSLSYPNLTTLSLESIQFNQEVGIEQFILRHGHTLTSLRLNNCTIAQKEDEAETAAGPHYPLRTWSQIWTSFSAELVVLENLTVVYISGWGHAPMRYSWRQDGYFWNCRSWNVEQDDAGLEQFEALVAGRRETGMVID